MIPLNLIKTRTTRYEGHDGKERAVLFHEDYEQLIANADLFHAFQRLLDYECNTLRYWVGQCQPQSNQWHIYQNQYNSLVCLRERMISPEWVLQFLDSSKFDMPEAKERVFK